MIQENPLEMKPADDLDIPPLPNRIGGDVTGRRERLAKLDADLAALLATLAGSTGDAVADCERIIIAIRVLIREIA